MSSGHFWVAHDCLLTSLPHFNTRPHSLLGVWSTFSYAFLFRSMKFMTLLLSNTCYSHGLTRCLALCRTAWHFYPLSHVPHIKAMACILSGSSLKVRHFCSGGSSHCTKHRSIQQNKQKINILIILFVKTHIRVRTDWRTVLTILS